MKRRALLLALALAAGCDGDPIGPSALYPGYFLASIDGDLLPAPADDLPEGGVVLAAGLAFPRGMRARGADGSPFVTYSRLLQLPGQDPERILVQLNYTLADGQLTVNLCPPYALCLIRTELVGPATRDSLVLTHYLGNQPRSVYRFYAALPD